MNYYNLVTKKEQSGLAPTSENWVEVQVVTNRPTDYPASFYHMTSNKPRRTIVGNVVTDTSNWELSSEEVIQQPLYKSLKNQRDLMLFGELTVGGVTILVEDQRDITVVLNLGDVPVNFKRGTGDRVTIDIADGILFKKAYKQKVQDAFNWEEIEEEKVTLADTHDKLKTLIES